MSKAFDLDKKPVNEGKKLIIIKLQDTYDSITSGYTDLAIQEVGSLVQEYSKADNVPQEVKTELNVQVATALKLVQI